MTFLKSIPLMASTALILLAGLSGAHAEDMKMDHSKMDHGSMMSMDHNGSQAGLYDAAMKTMHEGMSSVKATGDADVDFVQGMIPHHQGAIDMAKVVLEKGKDPEIKKLAEGIVKAQEAEIAQMTTWLKAHKK